ncbi:hypothetical protein PBAL39_01657 [Pedobacter sp. BAL39]|nr:hypothetical protein PBAL39_01657 [Pedobacter sp. BAL39]
MGGGLKKDIRISWKPGPDVVCQVFGLMDCS